MGEEAIKLATQIVLLIGALVGVFKVAQAPTPRSGPEQSADGQARPRAEKSDWGAFEPFKVMLAAYVPMLVPLIFIAAFMGLIGLMNLFSGTSKATAPTHAVAPGAASIGPTLSKVLWEGANETDRQLMRQVDVARSMRTTDGQDELLQDVVSRASKAGAFRVAAIAAASMTTTPHHDSALSAVVDGALAAGDLDAAEMAARSVTYADEQDEALKKVFRALRAGGASKLKQ